ncbi:uncharacterized protein LOC124491711 [Dermatophagoides farinae]|nr:uncharacterized protein LOC124491711 [Dermatophagoides farinae]XP_046910360.1 uncharacterized protein LOC124491711 [Dermatophagoides farinae]
MINRKNMNLPQQFCRAIKESLADNVVNQMIERIMNHFPLESNICLSNSSCNIELMLMFIENSIQSFRKADNSKLVLINEEMLHNRSKLMQKFIIQDDIHLLDFLVNVIEFLHKQQLSLPEIDKAVNVLNFEEVIPLYIRNHWTFARKPNGEPSSVEDRLQVVRQCLHFKCWIYYYTDPNEYF